MYKFLETMETSISDYLNYKMLPRNNPRDKRKVWNAKYNLHQYAFTCRHFADYADFLVKFLYTHQKTTSLNAKSRKR